MIQKVAPTPSPCRTNFRRNLNAVEKTQLMHGDVKTLLDVGVKTAQGIITPNAGAYEDLSDFSLRHHHAGTTEKAMGFIPAVRRFFATIEEYENKKEPIKDIITPFKNKDPLDMLAVAYDAGKGRIRHSSLRLMFIAPFGFPKEFETLGRVIPKEISGTKYTVNGVEKVTGEAGK